MRTCLRCCGIGCDKRLDGSCERLGETLGEALGETLGERFGDMLYKRLGDPNVVQGFFRQALSTIQESLNLSRLPSPDKGLVSFLSNETMML